MSVGFRDRLPDLTSSEFVDFMSKRARVGAVPSADFVQSSAGEKWVRFCYAVEDDVLERAAAMIKGL